MNVNGPSSHRDDREEAGSAEELRLWTRLEPPLHSSEAQTRFAMYARVLARMKPASEDEKSIENYRSTLAETARGCARADRQTLLAAGFVLTDLAVQGWQLRISKGRVDVRPPEVSKDRAEEKQRIRRQELVKRDAQLRTDSVQKFVRGMERPRIFNDKHCSIFTLMRDGRELATVLRGARKHINNGWVEALTKAIDPYLEFVSSEDTRCSFTGMRLMDIWRYFRHTWTNQYTSVPGRTMMFLVRDSAAASHPIIGIGALSSPIMQIRERDTWVGWHPETFLAHIRETPTVLLARWLISVVDTAIDEIYVDDLLEDGILEQLHLMNPDEAVIKRLLAESVKQRKLHHRQARLGHHRHADANPNGEGRWVARAKSHLFRSKRALALSSYLKARALLKEHLGRRPTAERLAQFATTVDGEDTIRSVLKKARADRVGIAVADLSVCGAVQPYNAVLGGKLVAMLATSPEVVLEYQDRYARAQSEIASSMAGRPIVRKPELVLLGTTSLYGAGSSQYNRINIPCEELGGHNNEAIRYEELGRSAAFGTSQFSEETVDALVELVRQSAEGQRVNSIFGEGVSPKLRKVRQGLNLLNFPSQLLLCHHRRRVIYGVSLVRNLREHLLGLDRKPRYLLAAEYGPLATAKIASWWRKRWLRGRILSDSVLDDVAQHTLVGHLEHGARVVLPEASEQQQLLLRHVAGPPAVARRTRTPLRR